MYVLSRVLARFDRMPTVQEHEKRVAVELRQNERRNDVEEVVLELEEHGQLENCDDG